LPIQAGTPTHINVQNYKAKYFNKDLMEIVEKYAETDLYVPDDGEHFAKTKAAVSGEVYFAKTSPFPDLKKIGGTSKTGPLRVQQLTTAGVPEPYQCYRHVKVNDWYLFEKTMHEYFKDVRVYQGREFFLLSDEETDKICDQLEGLVEMNEKEAAKWEFAMKNVSMRLTGTRHRNADKHQPGIQLYFAKASQSTNEKNHTQDKQPSLQDKLQPKKDLFLDKHPSFKFTKENGSESQLSQSKTKEHKAVSIVESMSSPYEQTVQKNQGKTKPRKHCRTWNMEKLNPLKMLIDKFVVDDIQFKRDNFVSCKDLLLKFNKLNHIEDMDKRFFFKIVQHSMKEHHSDKKIRNTTSKGSRGYRGIFI
jgi:hypothetical protein